MAKPKGSKFKKQVNKRKKGEAREHPSGGGFGFDKTKAIKELVGSTPSAPLRSKLHLSHSTEEEVYIVSSDSILDQKPQLATFDQLSKVSLSQLTSAELPDLEPEEELGFFFDSTPAPNVVSPQAPLPVLKQTPVLSNYERKKQKVLQDDSIRIDSEDDDDDLSSVSSSEDISMLEALSHWGKNDILQFEEPVKRGHKDNEDFYDYAMLEDATLDDICDSDQEFGLDQEEEDNILLESGMSFDLLENVPDSLKNSYKSMMHQEKNRVKKQAKKQSNLKQRMQSMQTEKSKGKKKNLLDQILHEFIRRDHIKTYKLSNLTYHGHSVVVPKIAKLFKLEVLRSGSNKKTITLSKTSKTCIPESYKQHIKTTTTTTTTSKFKSKARVPSRTPARDSDHGKLVASDSVPISSSNIGHRMLAAMGWKQGDAIGNNDDGIKEPVQVFMRAKRRGLGA
ncbi:hypothetical protein HPULCUR_010394 [Helicostylum pulchrum]|uniref:G-patch domain-containing protein n=1 Tax=Helicostylum pulchrum TaxID=562976 RepID=A0ABP9YD48_9FUNG